MSTQIYLACSLRAKPAAAEWAASLRRAGLIVTSTWHDEPGFLEDPDSDAMRAAIVRQIVPEIERASCIVVLAYLGEPRATYVEAGLALGMSKAAVWVTQDGRGRQVFDVYGRSVRVELERGMPHQVARVVAAVRKAAFL
jgi:hypothetical protein